MREDAIFCCSQHLENRMALGGNILFPKWDRRKRQRETERRGRAGGGGVGERGRESV